MKDIINKKCVVCTSETASLNNKEVEKLLKQVPGWSVLISEGVMQLSRTYDFNNFNDSVEFTNSVASMAEEQNHHPAILTEWGMATVTWWTHTIRGLHSNDFICALKTDEIYNS